MTGKKNYYDYIIASHVIEHTADFIGFLQDCFKMLTNQGILALAVPDKRYTLDYFRMVSTTGKMIDDYLTTTKTGSTGTLFDFYSHTVSRNNKTSWSHYLDKIMKRNYSFIHTHEQVYGVYDDAVRNPSFHDIHQYVFTPSSFMLLIAELGEFGFIDFMVDRIYSTVTDEFIVLLRKQNKITFLSPIDKKRLIKKFPKRILLIKIEINIINFIV